MTDPLRTLAANKLIRTGVPLDYGDPPNLAPSCTDEADFNSIVTDYYTLFRERLRGDVAFLTSIRRDRKVDLFDNALYKLRTARQHDDNPDATVFYDRWVSGYQPWLRSAEALAELFASAIQQLEITSNQVRRDQRLRSAWKDRATAEPEAVFIAVCSDLGAQFSHGNTQRLIRNVRNRLGRANCSRGVQAAIEDLCAQEITSQLRSLPLPYFEILDRLDLIGKQDARAALLVAYSIEAATNLVGEEFLLRVEETWKVAHAE